MIKNNNNNKISSQWRFFEEERQRWDDDDEILKSWKFSLYSLVLWEKIERHQKNIVVVVIKVSTVSC